MKMTLMLILTSCSFTAAAHTSHIHSAEASLLVGISSAVAAFSVAAILFIHARKATKPE
ncbi:MAG: hypothetical protein R3Y10_04170 [Ferrimonas sp.]